MKHELNAAEQRTVDQLLESFRFDFVPIRLTRTMVEKSIIDAGVAIRTLFARTGHVEYSALGRGSVNGIALRLPVLSKRGCEPSTVSFYRPKSKDGDPRFCIYDLRKIATVGSALLVCLADSELFFIVLDGGTPASLLRALAELLPERFDDFRNVSRTIAELTQEIQRIRNRGWIRTLRAGDTGIGFTFESLLGIRANSSREPDHKGVELKCHRANGSSTRVTLFSKTPLWGAIERGPELLKRAGRVYEDTGRKRLYCTIDTKPNSFDLALHVSDPAKRVDVLHKDQPTVYYTFALLDDCLHKKHRDTLFIRAETRGAGAVEEFQFLEVTYCSQPSFPVFLDLIESREVALDFTLSEKPSGGTRDHGYLWRIREGTIPRLFSYRRNLI